MALTYMGVVNKVLARLNEVQLTSGTFASATGFHATVKEAVNSAIFQINNQQFEWPFNYTSTSVTLVAGVREYALPATAKTVDWESFYIDIDLNLPIPAYARKLDHMDFNHYRDTRMINDLNSGEAGRSQPAYVTRLENSKYAVSSIPDQAYTLKYEYWINPTALSAYNDTTTIPDTFEEVLLNGTTYYAELFRQNFEVAQLYRADFDRGINYMRRLLVPAPLYARDTRTGGVMSRSGFE